MYDDDFDYNDYDELEEEREASIEDYRIHLACVAADRTLQTLVMNFEELYACSLAGDDLLRDELAPVMEVRKVFYSLISEMQKKAIAAQANNSTIN